VAENKKVIELIRVSTAGQAAADRASIPAQRAINRKTAAQYGLDIVRSIEIADVGGADVLRAPEILEMLKLMEQPEIVGVVCREFTRLMRPDNFADYALLQAFVDSCCTLYLPDGPVDFASKSGRFMGTVKAAIGGMEKTEMLERAWGGKEAKRRRGELAQNRIVLPFGVDYENGKWSYQPAEAQKIRQAFRQVLTGKVNYNAIAKQLGVTPRGAALILRNPIWKGWRILDKKRDPSSKARYAGKDGRQADRRKMPRPEDEIIRVRVIEKPLLSEVDWAKAQEIMGRKAQLHWREGRRQGTNPSRFTYAGFLRCAACGGPVHSVLARKDYYVCKASREKPHGCDSSYMAREALETTLDRTFGKLLTRPAFVQRCIAQLRRETKVRAGTVDREELEDAAARLEAKRGRILDTYLEGVLSATERDARLVAVDADLAALRTQLAALDAAAAPPALTPELLEKRLAPLKDWERWTAEQKRRALAVLAPSILVANGHVTSIGLALGDSVEYTRRPAASTTTALATASARRP
jgi:DNA invertase Pin-like site-specific DNA recombinase